MTIRVKQLGTTFVYETGPLPSTPIAVGGVNGSIQYNNSGLFGGSANLTFLNSYFNLTGSLLVLGDGRISGSLMQGEGSVALGLYSRAEGYRSVASSSYSHAEGSGSITRAIYSHAEGRQTTASGSYSHAEGYRSITSGTYSHAEGWLTIASGVSSHSEGEETVASGISSHAEGLQTSATADYSHAEGLGTVAAGYYSHAEGNQTYAFGDWSHAEGYQTDAIGDYSHVVGAGTIASGTYQYVAGKYNVRENASSLFVIGNGTGDSDANRKDVLRVEPGGRVEVTGSLVASLGMSGSLTKLSDGTSYLIAGTNVTIASASNGAVTISSTGGSGSPAGSDTEIQFNSGGSFGASANLNFDYGNSVLSLTGSFGMKGNIIPDADTTYTLGTSAKRWGHIYTGDLHLRNDRGDWTIVEEREYLCVVNNITGKKYKMMLQEIKDD